MLANKVLAVHVECQMRAASIASVLLYEVLIAHPFFALFPQAQITLRGFIAIKAILLVSFYPNLNLFELFSIALGAIFTQRIALGAFNLNNPVASFNSMFPSPHFYPSLKVFRLFFSLPYCTSGFFMKQPLSGSFFYKFFSPKSKNL